MRRPTRLPKKFLFLIAAGTVTAFSVGQQPEQAESFATTDHVEDISVSDDGILLVVPITTARTVGELLGSLAIDTGDHDEIWPHPDVKLSSGETVTVRHAKTITMKTAEGTRKIVTTMPDVDRMLDENGITFGEDDLVLPGGTTPLQDDATVQIIRVTIEEKSFNEAIPFDKQVKEDPDLSWRKTIVEQKGVSGVKTYTYRIKTHDGKTVEKKLIDTEITREPVTEVTTQGTYVKTGKTHTGLGTWYAYTGTLAAASPWLPLGSYVRVTNVGNGKQVIVKINDRGPFGPNRIIDLDKAAFQKIASLGAGVISLKVEEIVN